MKEKGMYVCRHPNKDLSKLLLLKQRMGYMIAPGVRCAQALLFRRAVSKYMVVACCSFFPRQPSACYVALSDSANNGFGDVHRRMRIFLHLPVEMAASSCGI